MKGSCYNLIYHFTVILVCVMLIVVCEKAYSMDFSVHGYYRYRFETSYELDTQRPNSSVTYDNDRFGLISFSQMRLRLEPNLKLNDNLSLHAQLDFLDNVLFGTSDTEQLKVHSPVIGTVSMPAGAGSLSMVGGSAGSNGSINVRRIWADILTPVGKLRVGRQPTHWGLGIFVNDGNSRQGDFGDTADRVLFVTKYEFNPTNAISFGVLGDIAYEAQRDPSIGGLADAIRENGRDTSQYAAFILYENPNFNIGAFAGLRRRNGGSGTTTTAYGIPESACSDLSDPDCLHPDRDGDGLGDEPFDAGRDGDTQLYFVDVYGRYEYREYRFQLEGVYLFGKISTGVAIDAIPFAGLPSPSIIELEPEQDIRVLMAAMEVDAVYNWGGEWKLMAGFAEGDANPLSHRITQFGFRPDYDIALLMFDVPLGTSPTIRQSGRKLAGGVPITGNFVNNAYYVSAGYKHSFDIRRFIKACDEFKIGGRVITAWAHKDVVALDFDELINPAQDDNLPAIMSRKKWYGLEFDVSLEGKFYEYLYVALEGGVLLPGGAYDIEVEPYGFNPASINQIPPDQAELAYMGRLTLMVEF